MKKRRTLPATKKPKAQISREGWVKNVMRWSDSGYTAREIVNLSWNLLTFECTRSEVTHIIQVKVQNELGHTDTPRSYVRPEPLYVSLGGPAIDVSQMTPEARRAFVGKDPLLFAQVYLGWSLREDGTMTDKFGTVDMDWDQARETAQKLMDESEQRDALQTHDKQADDYVASKSGSVHVAPAGTPLPANFGPLNGFRMVGNTSSQVRS